MSPIEQAREVFIQARNACTNEQHRPCGDCVVEKIEAAIREAVAKERRRIAEFVSQFNKSHWDMPARDIVAATRRAKDEL